MALYQQKIKAEIMRRKGQSIIKIAKVLNVSKSSVSMWCRHILLTQQQINKLRNSKGSAYGRWLGAESNRRKKIESIEKGFSEAFRMIGNVSRRDLLIAGLNLFWAEGAKTGSRFIFINSDPQMLKIMKLFLSEVMSIDENDFYATIQINAIHKSRIKKITKFWSKYLHIPLSHFSTPYYINSIPKKVYSNYNTYYGILRLKILRSSNLQYKMLGLIKAFQSQVKSG